jgi:hypothetical protein
MVKIKDWGMISGGPTQPRQCHMLSQMNATLEEFHVSTLTRISADAIQCHMSRHMSMPYHPVQKNTSTWKPPHMQHEQHKSQKMTKYRIPTVGL